MSLEKASNTPIKTEEKPRMFSSEEIAEANENLKSFEQLPEIPTAPVEKEVPAEVTAAESARLAEVKGRLHEVAAKQEAPAQEQKDNPWLAASKNFQQVQQEVRASLVARHASNPKEAKKIEKNFNKAVDLIHKGKIDKASKLFNNGGQLREVINSHIQVLASSGNVAEMRKIAEGNSLMEIYPDNLALLPPSITQSPKVQEKIRKEIERGFFANPDGRTRSREATTGEQIRRYQELGILTPQAAQEIVSSPRFQKGVEKDIKGMYKRMRKGSSDPMGLIRGVMDRYISEGLLTPARAEAVRRGL